MDSYTSRLDFNGVSKWLQFGRAPMVVKEGWLKEAELRKEDGKETAVQGEGKWNDKKIISWNKGGNLQEKGNSH